jgi:hypothetical protein
VFNKISDANLIKSIFTTNLLRQAFNFLVYSVFRCKKVKVDWRFWEGHKITVERVVEPKDVYWENISVTTVARIKKSLITYSITFGVL